MPNPESVKQGACDLPLCVLHRSHCNSFLFNRYAVQFYTFQSCVSRKELTVLGTYAKHLECLCILISPYLCRIDGSPGCQNKTTTENVTLIKYQSQELVTLA